ncbi:NmrA family NAD(P)-binding protein [Candidatus Poribacteria bacterium]|nr:NmrA family NAD(P)-binding protein [Candidatus Poribacteria bacterium]
MKSQNNPTSIVTGAFGYTGKYIARRLLSIGEQVKTLTWHDRDNPFGNKVEVFPFNFDKPDKLMESLRGASTFYNTYWIRFPRGESTYERAVENTKTLIEAAKQAGVRRFVHISITNCSANSPLPYFKGKALVEKAIIESGLSYAIIRPTVIFGCEDILINNIAWLLRKFPVFAIMGSGKYQLRPVFVEDVARIAVDAARDTRNIIIDAVGPEIYTFDELLRLIAHTVGRQETDGRSRSPRNLVGGGTARRAPTILVGRIRRPLIILHVPPSIGYFLSQFIGWLVGDVLLTRDEVKGLMSNLLVTAGPSTGVTRMSKWLEQNAATVGVKYASELKRHYR